MQPNTKNLDFDDNHFRAFSKDCDNASKLLTLFRALLLGSCNAKWFCSLFISCQCNLANNKNSKLINHGKQTNIVENTKYIWKVSLFGLSTDSYIIVGFIYKKHKKTENIRQNNKKQKLTMKTYLYKMIIHILIQQ